MPGPSSEPDKYTIDDMMERLANKPGGDDHEDGQLVTRADGSQAIRVRKRKRRSHQPHKEMAAKTRRLRIAGMILGVLVLVVLGGLSGALVIYSNSAPFRKGLTDKISRATGAEVKFHQFRINPTGANVGVARLQWPQGNVLSEAVLQDVHATTSFSSLLGKHFRGNEVVAAQGSLQLLTAPAGSTPFSTLPSEPFPLAFKRYGIRSTTIKLGETTTISNAEASLYPSNLRGNPELRLTHGSITTAGWPTLRLDRGLMEVKGQDLEVISISLLHATDDRGSMVMNGTFHPLATDQESILSIKAEFFQFSGVVGENLERFISGRIDTKPSAKANFLTLQPSARFPGKLVMEWTGAVGSQIDLRNFPFLFSLAQTTQDSWYESPAFLTEAEGVLRCSDGKVSLAHLRLATKGRMAIRGDISVDAQKNLSGELQVGVPDSMIQSAATQRLDEIFGEASEGFRWITVRLSGTTDAPKDDFKEQFVSSERRKQQPQEAVAPSSFDELTRPKGR